MRENKNPRHAIMAREHRTTSLYSNHDIKALKARAADYLHIVHDVQHPYKAFSSPWREDKHSSCVLDRRTNHVKDFGRSSVYYDVFDMARLDFGAERFPDQIEAVAHALGVSVLKETIPYEQKPRLKQRITYPKPAPIADKNIFEEVQEAAYNLYEPQGAHALKYLYKRGFADEDIGTYSLGWVNHPSIVNPEWKAFPYGRAGYVVLPFPNSDNWQAVNYCVFRPLFQTDNHGRKVSKEIKPKGTAPIYREYRLCEPGETYVTEGIYDAMSLEIMHGVRSCALCGGGCARLLDVLSNTPRSKRSRLVLAFDSDDAGEQFKVSLSKGLKDIGATFEIAEPYPDGCKDANDVLISQRMKGRCCNE